SLVKQWKRRQTVKDADWLIGAGLLAPGVNGRALRSMKEPGTAYDDPRLGADPQPSRMRDYVKTGEDNGGVHINSGIPNRAFFLTADILGGFAWERAGAIWYDALTTRFRPTTDFAGAAAATVTAARQRFGGGSLEVQGVERAWATVGVRIDEAAAA